MLSTPSGVATKYGDGKTDKDGSITPSQVPEKKLVVEVSTVAPTANELPWPSDLFGAGELQRAAPGLRVNVARNRSDR